LLEQPLRHEKAAVIFVAATAIKLQGRIIPAVVAGRKVIWDALLTALLQELGD